MTFELLQQLCKREGITVTSLCKEITGSSGNLPTWKKNNIRTEHLIQIAIYFQVSTDYLLGRTLRPEPVPPYLEDDIPSMGCFRAMTMEIATLENFWANATLAKERGDFKTEEQELDTIIQACIKGGAVDFYKKMLPSMTQNKSAIELLREYANTVYKERLSFHLDKAIQNVRKNKVENLLQKTNKHTKGNT